MTDGLYTIGESRETRTITLKASKMSVLGQWIVHTIVRKTIAAALGSRPDVGSSMKMIDGFTTNSIAIVSRFHCLVAKPSTH